MKVKVCGLRSPQNIQALAELPIDFMGFIFYEKSTRFVDQLPDVKLPNSINKVGVFVNAGLEEVEEIANRFELNYLQLHGKEAPEYCQLLNRKGYQIIKAFSVGADFDWAALKAYEGVCDYFLLDTKGANYGGNGVKFDWSILGSYPYKLPFLLSGGIDLDSAEALRQLKIPQLFAVDINSRFEQSPAIKDVEQVAQFIQKIQA